ncbi:hypothetical protein RF55_18199 [Lasius niger]|uniref:Uncharacterized protein n=1 Tax=Lasius niger TaxID=67767 RepID=A0A0J7K192_LASNI|nr:hypothetical protein RF55_18199 [Lasius niger]
MDGKKVGGSARKNKTEEGKEGGERTEGTRTRTGGVMEGLREEKKNGGKDVKGVGTGGGREVWRGESEGMGWEVRRKKRQEVREKEEEEGRRGGIENRRGKEEGLKGVEYGKIRDRVEEEEERAREREARKRREKQKDRVLERRGEVGRRWRLSVDEDLTREERKMKWRIKERARLERNRGKRVEYNNRRLWVDGREWKWDEEVESWREYKEF